MRKRSRNLLRKLSKKRSRKSIRKSPSYRYRKKHSRKSPSYRYRKKHSSIIQKIKYIKGSGYISGLKEENSCYIKDFDECIYGKSKNKLKGKGNTKETRKCKYNLKNQICQPA